MTYTFTPTKLKHSKPEQHLWQAWGSDARFECCVCGATRRADYLQPDGSINPNPCVQMWGLGPAGATCKTCIHLTSHKQSKTWYKCSLRGVTHGAKSDQKLRWDACKRYELKLLPRELPPDAPAAALEARVAALAAYMGAFHQAAADLEARKLAGKEADE